MSKIKKIKGNANLKICNRLTIQKSNNIMKNEN